MISIDDLTRLWSWGLSKWWHFPIAVIAILVLLIGLYLGFFIKTEDRIGALFNWYNGIATWIGTQSALADYYSELVLAIIFSAVTMGVIFTLIAYAFNKHMVEKVNSAENRASKIQDAYIRLLYAYRNARGITVREKSYDMGGNRVTEGSKEHLRSMDHYDLYIEAERLAREAKVPADA